MPKNTMLKLLPVVVLLLPLLIHAAPALAQGGAQMCVSVPDTIPAGDTETLLVEVELFPDPAAATLANDDTHVCAPVDEVYDVMGVGIAGVRLGNFEIDPADNRFTAPIIPGVTDWVWSINASGSAGSHHNLIVYTYVDDPDRSSGYRSITRIPVSIDIVESGGVLSGLGDFFDSAIGRVTAIAGAIAAVAAAIGAVMGLTRRGRNK